MRRTQAFAWLWHNNKMRWFVKGKELFIFYLIFWVCGRIYIFADTYLHTKIFHGIGLHFDIICLVAYIIHITPSKQIGKLLFWRYFLYYEISALMFYSYTQLTGNHKLKQELWINGINSSGAILISKSLGIVQDLFIPAFIVLVIYSLWKKAYLIKGNYDG